MSSVGSAKGNGCLTPMLVVGFVLGSLVGVLIARHADKQQVWVLVAIVTLLALFVPFLILLTLTFVDSLREERQARDLERTLDQFIGVDRRYLRTPLCRNKRH